MAKSTKKVVKVSATAVAVKKGFEIEGQKAVYNRELKEYTTKETFKIKAVYKPATKKVQEMVVFSCKGCYLIATKSAEGIKLSAKAVAKPKKYDELELSFLEALSKDKAKALRTYLLGRYNLKTMNWDTLVEKCEPMDKEEEKIIDAVAESVAC